MLMIAQAVKGTVAGALKPQDNCKTQSCQSRCSPFFVGQRLDGNALACSCDPQCRYVFNDCCFDFETVCANTTDTTHSHFNWGCHNPFMDQALAHRRLRMVNRCMQGWPNDEISINCSTRKASSFHDILLAVPVFDENKVLFRNVYCAFCNGVKPKMVSFWKVKLSSAVKFNNSKPLMLKGEYIPYDPFLMDKGVKITDIRFQGNKIGVRLCIPGLISTCLHTYDKILVDNCEKGPAALISDGVKNFKNSACLICNYGRESAVPRKLLCGPQYEPTEFEGIPTGTKYSLILGQELYRRFETERVCPIGYLFDAKQRHCLKMYTFPQLSSFQAFRAHYISIQYKIKTVKAAGCFATNRSSDKTVFLNAFERNLHDQNNNADHISMFTVIPAAHYNYYIALSIANTIQAKANNLSTNNTTSIASQLKDFTLKMKTPIDIGKCVYTPKSVKWREMICTENRTFPITIEDAKDKSTIYFKEMQRNYSKGEFWVFNEKNKTIIVVCEHFLPTNCSYLINTTDESDWVLHDNLSLFYKVTGTFFEHGDYSMKNNTVWLCLSEKHLLHQPTRKIEISSIHDDILPRISTIAYIISVTSLVTILVIYSIFPAQRNLPGKNLMLLSVVLAMAQLLMLLQDHIPSVFCKVTWITKHYFFLASFTSSGSIAYHSYITFYSISKGRLHKTRGRFFWYMLYSLTCPALIVAVFWLFNFYNVLDFDSDKTAVSCWFGKNRGLYIAFLGPMFLQFFVNMALLFVTLKLIYKCSKANLALGEKNKGVGRHDIRVYLRMSTLMGLTWIFAALLISFPSVLALDYLFSVVNGLQGFYIALAFLSTKRVRKLLGGKNQRERSTICATQNRGESNHTL